MRRLLPLLLVLCVSPVHAGLYNPAEPNEGVLGEDFTDFILNLTRLQSIPAPEVENDYPLRRRYQLIYQGKVPTDKLDEGVVTERMKELTRLDRALVMSAVYLRMQQPDKAINLLEPLARKYPTHFLILSNLSTAYFHRYPDDRRALDMLDQALEHWTPDYDEFFKAELKPDGKKDYSIIQESIESAGLNNNGLYPNYRRAEELQRKLLRARYRELLQRKGAEATFEAVDAIFDDGGNPPKPIRFVDKDGNFAVGKISPFVKAKLPQNAIDDVKQLLIWMPTDARLMWLLGELYNAEGGDDNIKSAQRLFEEAAKYKLRVQSPEFMKRRDALRNYKPGDESPPPARPNFKQEDAKKPLTDDADWRPYGVTFAVGLAVGVFAVWQFQEVRRRRRAM